MTDTPSIQGNAQPPENQQLQPLGLDIAIETLGVARNNEANHSIDFDMTALLERPAETMNAFLDNLQNMVLTGDDPDAAIANLMSAIDGFDIYASAPVPVPSEPKAIAPIDEDVIENAVYLLDTFLGAPGARNPILEAMFYANRDAYQKLQLFFIKSFSPQAGVLMDAQFFDHKAQAFFKVPFLHLTESQQLFVKKHHDKSRAQLCAEILQNISNQMSAPSSFEDLMDVEDGFRGKGALLLQVKENMSRGCFESDEEFEYHVLKQFSVCDPNGNDSIYKEYKEARDYILAHPSDQTSFIYSRSILNPNSIPVEIGQLKQVTKLDFAFQFQLQCFPDSMTALSQLVELNLSFINLKSIPSFVRHLSRLQSFDMSICELTSVCREIVNLTALTHLCLSGNKIGALPSEFESLTQLTSLKIQGNLFSSLPPQLLKLRNLTTFWFDMDKIQLQDLSLEARAWFEHLKLNKCNFFGNTQPDDLKRLPAYYDDWIQFLSA